MDPQETRPAEEGTPAAEDAPGVRGMLARLSRAWLLIGLIVLANLFMNGLTFGHGDHYSHIPALKHYMDPAFLSNDWYIQTLGGLNVRHFFVATIAPVAGLIGIPATFLLLQIAVIATMAWAFTMIGRHFFGETAGWWVALVGVTAVAGEGVGFVSFWAYLARAQDVGHALALLAVAFWLGRKGLLAGLCLGLSIDFHPLLGAQTAVLLGLVHLLSRPREWKLLAGLVIISGIAAIPAFWLYFSATGAGGPAVNRAQLLDTHYFRVLGRTDPLRWTIKTWASLLAFAVAAFGVLASLRREATPGTSREGKWMLIMPSAIFLLAIPLGVFVMETALCQPLRAAVWPRIAATCLIGAWCQRRWREGGARYLLVFAGLASVLNDWVLLSVWSLVLLVSADWKPGLVLRGKLLSLERYLSALYHAKSVVYRDQEDGEERMEVTAGGRKTWRWFLVAAAVVIAVAAAPHWGKASAAFTTSLPVFPLSILVAVMLTVGLRIDFTRTRHLVICLLGMICVLALRLPSGPLGPDYPKWVHVQPWLMLTHREEVVANWCRYNLPPDARLLVPPNSSAFRLHAQRAVVVDYKCFPFAPAGVIEWRRRMLDIAGLAPDTVLREKRITSLTWGYNQRPPNDVVKLGRKYQAGYFITRSEREYPFIRMFTYSNWKVYRLPVVKVRPKPKG
jgi:Domain of unknown function (DUF6798)